MSALYFSTFKSQNNTTMEINEEALTQMSTADLSSTILLLKMYSMPIENQQKVVSELEVQLAKRLDNIFIQ